jgi:nickel transport protein
MKLLKILPVATIVAAGILYLSNIAWAHGVAYEMVETSPAVTFKSGFSSGDPISYGQVLIYAPDNAEVEFQNGRTDKNGVFSFLPDQPGIWKVEVDGGLGHKLIFDVEVAGSVKNELAAHEKEAPLQGSIEIRALLGISLIFNLCLAASYLRARRKVTAMKKIDG